MWAESHPEFYPVRVNRANKESLLRIPGIGPKTVGMILKIRREKNHRLEDLGLKGKRFEKAKQYVIFE
jgi:predicted DNA-binding helix-hairpin-helix protein